MKGSAETVTQEEAIIQAGFAGRGLISSIRSRADTPEEDTRSTRLQRWVRGSDTPRVHRAVYRSWWNNELPKSRPNLPSPRPFFVREQLMGGDTLMPDRRLSIAATAGTSAAHNLSPVIKVTIERNNSDESRNFPLPGAHSLPPQSTLLNGSSVTRNLRFRT